MWTLHSPDWIKLTLPTDWLVTDLGNKMMEKRAGGTNPTAPHEALCLHSQGLNSAPSNKKKKKKERVKWEPRRMKLWGEMKQSD